MQQAILLVLADPAPDFEEEFNAWYDTEHLPERAALCGFVTALRFTSLGDGPRFAALYDLERPEVLQGPEYAAVSGDNFSPWTRRAMARAHPLRMSGVLTGRGRATGPLARLLITTLEGSDDADQARVGLQASFGAHPGHLQSRVFRGLEPEQRMICISEFAGGEIPKLDVAAFGDAGLGISLAAGYRPYRR